MTKNILVGLALSAAVVVSSSAATKTNNEATMGPWYAFVGTGFAWTLNTGVSNPDPTNWDFANEGYDSDLGHGGFYSLGFGRSITDYLHLDLSYTNYATMHYQKYQTGQGTKIGSTGNTRTRFFDVDSQSVLINFILQPIEGTFTAQLGDVSVFPFIGAGIGAGFNRVTNFHTVSSLGSVTTIGDPNNNTDFAWQGTVGLTAHPNCSHLYLDVGYRYFDGGKFKSADVFTINTPGSLGAKASAAPLQGRFKSNQAYANLRYMF